MPEVIHRRSRIVESFHACRPEPIEAPLTPVTNRGSQAKPGTDQSLPFQPLESGMDGACRDITVQPLLNFTQNPAAVGVFSKPHDREQHCLLECTECLRHSAYIVGGKLIRSR